MLFAVHAAFAVVGLIVVMAGRIPVGSREVRNPLASLIGGILAGSLPLTVLFLTFIILPDLASHARVGLDNAYQTAIGPVWWVHPLILVLTLAVAVGLTYLGAQADEPLPRLGDAPVVPSDLLEKAGPLTARSEAIATDIPAWASAAPPAAPAVFGRYTAPGKEVPPEVEALGTARRLFRPSTAGSIGAWWDGEGLSSALVFDTALVVVTGDEFVVVPWDAIEAVTDEAVRTADGQSVRLPARVDELSLLRHHVRQRVGERLAADVQRRLDAGDEVSFGAVRVTAEELRYGQRSLPWFEVCHVRIHEMRSLHVTRGDSPLPWCMVPREKLHNEFLLLELMGRLAPGAVQTTSF